MATAVKQDTPAFEALKILREPFPAHQISKLPKESRKQIDERKADRNKVVWNCGVCGGTHHKDAVHLDYVGHAALTDRLLDTDIEWSWEPLAFDQLGLPAFDGNGGLWIKLTVCGVTRLGYGSADGKSGGDAKKEIIGDALRNAAMRFGAALDLWHKGDLHADDDERNKPANDDADFNPETGEVTQNRVEKVPGITKIKERLSKLQTAGNAATGLEEFNALVHSNADDLTKIKEANHAWWTGDGEDFEGFKKWIVRRRAELAPSEESEAYRELIAALNDCDTRHDLVKLVEDYGDLIETLDGAESRRWETHYQFRASAIEAMDQVNA